jgi:hypothetical protein
VWKSEATEERKNKEQRVERSAEKDENRGELRK